MRHSGANKTVEKSGRGGEEMGDGKDVGLDKAKGYSAKDLTSMLRKAYGLEDKIGGGVKLPHSF